MCRCGCEALNGLDDDYSAPDLESKPLYTSVYVRLPGELRPRRYTKTTVHHWKRVDNQTRNQWVTHTELAAIVTAGTITNLLGETL